jgi:NAD+ diphosphatase
MTLAYVSSPLDRRNDWRGRPDKLLTMWADQRVRNLLVRGDQVVCNEGQPSLHRRLDTDPEIFLGTGPDGAPWFAQAAPESADLQPLRGLMLSGAVDGETLSILAQARSLVYWHERHGFCACCGAATAMADAGYRRHCPSCGADHFPRTDPVVIMVVKHGRDLLLGRQAAWTPGMYSALAGFMEPGETIEQAARREVLEESGVKVGAVRYQSSQPWPFPASLMIGLIGEAESRDITVDTTELEDARWFSPADVEAMLHGRHVQGFHASHPYAIAHHLITVALA